MPARPAVLALIRDLMFGTRIADVIRAQGAGAMRWASPALGSRGW